MTQAQAVSRWTSWTVGPAVGAGSRPVRFLVAAGVVAVWWTLGRPLLDLSPQAFLLLGVPILLVFQVGIHRQPLRTLWVRSGPGFRLDAWFVAIWVLLSIFPLYAAVTEASHSDLSKATEFGAAIVGAFGMAYAIRAMRGRTWGQLGLCIVMVAIVGVGPQFLSLLLPHVVHIRTAHPLTATPGPVSSTQIAAQWLLISPVGFVVEEVFFRGGLDTYVHRGEKGTGWASAVFVSALWGLWHLNVQDLHSGRLLSTIAGLLVSQVLIGVILSYWWRRSGNLLLSNSAHGMLEAVRNGLVGAGLF